MWSGRILAELRAAILRVHPELDPSRIDACLHAMDVAYEDELVEDWKPPVDGIAPAEDPGPGPRPPLAGWRSGVCAVHAIVDRLRCPDSAVPDQAGASTSSRTTSMRRPPIVPVSATSSTPAARR